MTRILHLVHTPRLSGAEMLVRDLCLRHQQQGHCCAIAAFAPTESGFRPHQEALAAAGVAILVPDRPVGRLDRVRHLRRAIAAFKPDAIFAHSVLPALYGRLALNWFGRKPLFVPVLHSATNDDYADPALRLSEWILARRADHVVAVSEQAARMYRKRIPHGAPVTVIPNGIDLARFEEAAARRPEHRAALGLAEGQKLILQVGRLSPVKQQLFTLESLLPLLQQTPTLNLWFAGLTEDASYARQLESSIATSGVSDRVRLLGSRDDIPALLASADLYVMPSLEEAHSIAMIEALYIGVPVAASSISAFSFAESYDRVLLTKAQDLSSMRHACTTLLHQGIHVRKDDNFDLSRSAQKYLSLADMQTNGAEAFLLKSN